jgi:glycosyltransferase involved in cell wall biosynthesis
MKIAVVLSHPVQYYSPIFRELARRADVTVFYGYRSTPHDQARAGFNIAFDWDVDLLSGYRHEFLVNVSASPNASGFAGVDTPDVSRCLADGRFGAVLVMGWHLKGYWQAIRAARQLGIPVLVRGDSHLDTVRGPLKRALKNLVYPRLLRTFDAALYVGQKSRAYYEHYGVPADRLFFSPHCVDNEWFASRATFEARERLRQECGVASDVRIALFAGKLLPLKRPFDLVDAAALARAAGANIEIMIAGAGPLDGAVRARAQSAGVPLYALGFRNQTEMPAVYAACDMLVLLSDSETWGLVANEALACGRPVIVSDACGCAPDLAADGRAGLVVPVGNIPAIAEALREIAAGACRGDDIAKKSVAYSVAVAVDGMLAATAAVSRTRG